MTCAVLNREVTSSLGEQLAPQAGISTMRQLVEDFRASMVLRALPLTCRLLMLNLGTDAFKVVVRSYLDAVPPQMFASLEAEAFADFLETALSRCRISPRSWPMKSQPPRRSRTASTASSCSPSNPSRCSRALADSRLPDAPLARGAFEVCVAAPDIEFLTTDPIGTSE